MSSLDHDCVGGSYGYAKRHFRSSTVASLVNATYFLSVVFGNVGGALVGIGYMKLLIPLAPELVTMVTIGVIWMLTCVNIRFGPKAMMRFQGVCTAMTCIPVFLVAFAGWTRFDANVFWESWNVSPLSDIGAMQRGLNVQLYAFTGLETAAALSSIVRDAQRDVPIATIAGVLIASLGYVLSCAAISGLFSAHSLGRMSSPFAAAVTHILGGAEWAGTGVALLTVFSSFGSVGAWILVASETSASAARDGLFPAAFSNPQRGLVFIATLMTAIVILCSLGEQPFTVVSSLASLLTLVPYATTAIALARRRTSAWWNIIACISLFYCSAALFGTQVWLIGIAAFIVVACFLFIPLMTTTTATTSSISLLHSQ